MAGEAQVGGDRAEKVGGAPAKHILRRRCIDSQRFALFATLLGLLAACVAASWAKDKEISVEELKAKVAAAPEGERPHLCVEIAERQLSQASKLYADGQTEKAEAALSDVASYSETARDVEVQSHKHIKQTEIAVRKMTLKLSDLKHTVTHDEQVAIQNTIDRLQRVRDDLLVTMFPKGG